MKMQKGKAAGGVVGAAENNKSYEPSLLSVGGNKIQSTKPKASGGYEPSVRGASNKRRAIPAQQQSKA